MKKCVLEPFGKNLLKLLQEEGAKSENALIRETSLKAIEVLSQVEKEEHKSSE